MQGFSILLYLIKKKKQVQLEYKSFSSLLERFITCNFEQKSAGLDFLFQGDITEGFQSDMCIKLPRQKVKVFLLRFYLRDKS